MVGRALDPAVAMEYHFCGPVGGRGGGGGEASAAAAGADAGVPTREGNSAAAMGLMPAAAVGGVPMSAQGSAAGGEPMSRQASGAGAGMRRTASGTGSLLGASEGRRVRTRLS
jgi:hypothetical protein